MVTSYPASGYRNVGSGAVTNERSFGYSWSASPNNATVGWDLYFDGTSARPQDGYQRGGGFPVRCVQEFATA